MNPDEGFPETRRFSETYYISTFGFPLNVMQLCPNYMSLLFDVSHCIYCLCLICIFVYIFCCTFEFCNKIIYFLLTLHH